MSTNNTKQALSIVWLLVAVVIFMILLLRAQMENGRQTVLRHLVR